MQCPNSIFDEKGKKIIDCPNEPTVHIVGNLWYCPEHANVYSEDKIRKVNKILDLDRIKQRFEEIKMNNLNK